MQTFFTTLLVENYVPYFLKKHLRRIKSRLPLFSLSLEEMQKKVEAFLVKNLASKKRYRFNIYFDSTHLLEMKLTKEDAFFNAPITLQSSNSFEKKQLVDFKRVNDSKYEQKKRLPKNCDWLFLNESGILLETCIANILWVKDGALYYVDPTLTYYQGLTQSLLIDKANEMGIKVVGCKAKLDELFGADLVLYTNCIRGVSYVHCIDDRKLTHCRDQLETWLTIYEQIKRFEQSKSQILHV